MVEGKEVGEKTKEAGSVGGQTHYTGLHGRRGERTGYMKKKISDFIERHRPGTEGVSGELRLK